MRCWKTACAPVEACQFWIAPLSSPSFAFHGTGHVLFLISLLDAILRNARFTNGPLDAIGLQTICQLFCASLLRIVWEFPSIEGERAGLLSW
jgi:hypothetical protein